MTLRVWFVPVTVEEGTLARFARHLTPQEWERASRFRFEADRRRAIVSRGALRELLDKFSASGYEIVETPFGKPRLAQGGVEFNVSHSGDLVMIALADAPVGVDIERIRPLRGDAQRIARAHFSSEEITRLASSPRSDEEFFSIWTAKEAVVKAEGHGLRASLLDFTVPELPGAARGVRGVEQWWVRGVPVPASGYVAALASADPAEELIVSDDPPA